MKTVDYSRQNNIEKYGDKDDDVISRAYREDKIIGDVWCLKNVEKYMRRFISKSAKSNNLADLKKAQDYINRAVEANEKLLAKNEGDVKNVEIIEK